MVYPGTRSGCADHTRVSNLVVMVILGYETWFWSYSGTKPLFWAYSGTQPDSCHNRVPNLFVLVIVLHQT